ncbi:hypothetical protein C8K36_102239 [Rhodococcus sp. OK519]|nr:hypothetical protein C8K36_102239 [Rhodococcus sp. OK519]
MGSIGTAIQIPLGSADTVLAGLINSVTGVIAGFGTLVGEALGSLNGISG